MRLAWVLGLWGVLVAAGGSARADIYQWTDADGVVHFTNQKPRGKERARWQRIYAGDGAKAVARRGDCARCDTIPARDGSSDRFRRYDAYIREASELYQIPEYFIRAVIHVESNYDPRVVSSAGARGLMQLMPSVVSDMRVADVHDPRDNIMGGTRLLRILANRYDGDLVLTIAAYHAGAGNVARYNGVPPFETTQRYVRMVLGQYHRYKALALGGASAVRAAAD
jgi:soluble lytic murein transglycosylase-like protein